VIIFSQILSTLLYGTNSLESLRSKNFSILDPFLCYNNTDGYKWPQVTYHFEGLGIALPDDNVLVKIIEPNTYCLLTSGQPFDPSTKLQLGIYVNIAQQNFAFEYDLKGSRLEVSATESCAREGP
jgi:hypothetical protein